MTNIVILSSVTSIGNGAFKNCNGLTYVYVSWETPLDIATEVFDGVDTKNCILYVPNGTYQDYWFADEWGNFENIVEYDVTSINKTTITSDIKETARYSIDGLQLNAPTKGVNIVKYNNGSVKKIVVP